MRGGLAGLAVLVTLLGGCTSASPDLEPATAETGRAEPAPVGREAQWALAPDFVAAPTVTTIDVFVVELACTGGRSPQGRIAQEVEYLEDEIVITIRVAPMAGGRGPNTCPGVPPTPFTVELDEPLGDRRITNGAMSELAQRDLLLPGEAIIHESEDFRAIWPTGVEDDLNDILVTLHDLAVTDVWPPELLPDVFASDGVAMILGGDVARRNASLDQLRTRSAWEFDRFDEPYAGVADVLSPLDVLAQPNVIVGRDLSCPSSTADRPPQGMQDRLLLRVQGFREHGRPGCDSTAWVDVYVNEQGLVVGIRLGHWEPVAS